MVEFGDLQPNDLIYIVEENPVTILELRIIHLGYDDEYTKKVKLANTDISFEVDFETIKHNVYLDKEEAYAIATKFIFDETNKFIRDLTEGFMEDYFDLDKAIEKYKLSHPELFI